MFILSLQQKYFRYGLTTTRAILDHLYATYAIISSADVQENNAVFSTPYNVNQPIESLFNWVENCGDYAAAGNTPYSLEQVISSAFQLVYHTGPFVDDCKSCKRLTTQQKLGSVSRISSPLRTTSGANLKAPPPVPNSTPPITCRIKLQRKYTNNKPSTPSPNLIPPLPAIAPLPPP